MSTLFNFNLRRSLLTIATVFLTTNLVMADNQMIRYGFTSTNDDSGTYTGTLDWGASLSTVGDMPIVDMGSNWGKFTFGSNLGNFIQTLDDYTISVNTYIPTYTDLTKAGNFLWCFSKSNTEGYIFFSAAQTRFAITQTNYDGEQTVGSGSALAKGQWLNVTYVQSGNTGTVYIDGVQKAQKTNITLKPKDINKCTVNYLAVSCYPKDAMLQGARYNEMRIYNYAIDGTELTTLNQNAIRLNIMETIADFTLGNVSSVISNLTLPTAYEGMTVSWATSDANVVAADGTITRPATGGSAQATLTATFSRDGASATKEFVVTVLQQMSDQETVNLVANNLTISGNLNNLYTDLSLPTNGDAGTTISWESSQPEYITNEGNVLKYADEKLHVTLTATVSLNEVTATKTIDVYLHKNEPYSHYLFVYFPNNEDENIYYAVSKDGYNYQPLNNGTMVLSSSFTVDGGLRDPHIYRAPNGKFYMVATDMKCSKGWNSNHGMVLMSSDDMITWKTSCIDFKVKYADKAYGNSNRVWAPQSIWDPDYDNGDGTYGRMMVYFSLHWDGGKSYDVDYYCYANDDFTDFITEPTLLLDPGSGIIDMDIVYNETDQLYHAFYKGDNGKGGGAGIYTMTSSTLTAPAGQTAGSQWQNKKGTLQQTTKQVEGSGMFKRINEDSWILMYDCFSSGFYQFCSSSDMENFTWVKDTKTSGAFTPRHGTVMAITQAEYEALLQAFPTTGLTDAHENTIPASTKILGGDLSMLPKYEEAYIPYYNSDGILICDDLLNYLKSEEVGWNAIRIRLMVNPENASTKIQRQGICQDLDYVTRIGKRIKDAGYKFLLDFHYSDVWADPGVQTKPQEWQTLTTSELTTRLYDYTKECLQHLCAGGATPDYIQTGNEITFGMLWTDGGKLNIDNDNKWDVFTGFLKSAGTACREVCPEAKIIIHTEHAQDETLTTKYYTRLNNANVDYDVIGLSYYPFWHESVSNLGTLLTSLESSFPAKKVQIVETAYYYQYQPTTGIHYDFSSTWPITAEGQRQFTADLVEELNKHDNVDGLYWWFPEENCKDNTVVSSWINRGLWDNNTGRALPALYEMKNFLNSKKPATGIKEQVRIWEESNRNIYDLNGRLLSAIPKHGIYIVQGKKVWVR